LVVEFSEKYIVKWSKGLAELRWILDHYWICGPDEGLDEKIVMIVLLKNW